MPDPADTIARILADAVEADALAAKATRGPWTADVPPGELWAHVCAPEGPELFKAVMHGRRPDADNARLAAAARLGWPRDAHRAAAGARLAGAVARVLTAQERCQETGGDSFGAVFGRSKTRQAERLAAHNNALDEFEVARDALPGALAAYLAECADVAPVREAE